MIHIKPNKSVDYNDHHEVFSALSREAQLIRKKYFQGTNLLNLSDASRIMLTH